jgi:hypothetical protein
LSYRTSSWGPERDSGSGVNIALIAIGVVILVFLLVG